MVAAEMGTTGMKHSSLDGKYAVVTGGSQGLGAATARLLAARGAAGVVLSGRDEQRGKAMVAELEAAGCRARFVAGDLQELANCRRVIAAAEEAFGTLHVLVNAAAVTDRGSIWDTSPELYDRIMQVNARAPFFLIQDAVKLMQRGNIAGSIVNISSVVTRGGAPWLSAYAMAKSALNVLTRNVAYAVMRSRIRVNAINVGWMDTPAEDVVQRRYHSAGGDWLPAAEARMPFGRLLKPQEVARAVAFLASDESGMMTGSVIDFDQSVAGGGSQPIPPPYEEWPPVRGISFR
jgi:NAD(P)-dependent dehydrogenase (short-subunit alcohol dehydrogenase family)